MNYKIKDEIKLFIENNGEWLEINEYVIDSKITITRIEQINELSFMIKEDKNKLNKILSDSFVKIGKESFINFKLQYKKMSKKLKGYVVNYNIDIGKNFKLSSKIDELRDKLLADVNIECFVIEGDE